MRYIRLTQNDIPIFHPKKRNFWGLQHSQDLNIDFF